jgi:copper(I)-binding protein/cytochrome oxidase Cu insertion factor (SCO1/SenC/PrrC family)
MFLSLFTRRFCLMGLLWLFSLPGFAASPWGADYFPNIPLIDQDGKKVNFFDDLIENKIVAINFIYTSCPDSCPLETAQLIKVQEILGERVGKDVFFYSISIDPDTDTPPVLKEYKERFGARWNFYTGKESDITELRRKLGLYIEEIQDGSLNHNVSMIIGNQSTGRWMRRSPFENSYVLADQIGNWLDGWKSPQKGGDYASAPKLRNISQGEQMFRTRCQTCHSITGEEASDAIGPDLLGVTDKRDLGWLMNWLRAPDQMLKDKDPIAIALYAQYKGVAMPNMRLNQHEVMDLIKYIKLESQRLTLARNIPRLSRQESNQTSTPADEQEDVVAIMNAWVRQAVPKSKVNAGYLTLINIGDQPQTIVAVTSNLFAQVEVHEMAMDDGLMKMQELKELTIPANGQMKLAPGGKHLMLKQPVKDLTAGEEVELSIQFQSGKSQTISVKVKDK